MKRIRIFDSRVVWVTAGLLLVPVLARGQVDSSPFEDLRASVDKIRAALSDKETNVERQRAALLLIAEGLDRHAADRLLESTVLSEADLREAARLREAVAKFKVIKFKPRAEDFVTQALWLRAYGRLIPAPGDAMPFLEPYLPEKPTHPPEVTREAADAVAVILTYNYRQISPPPITPTELETADDKTIRAEAERHLKFQAKLTKHSPELLRLAANAAGYEDEDTRRRGLRAIESAVATVQQRLTSNYVGPERTRAGVGNPIEALIIANQLSSQFLEHIDATAPRLSAGLQSADPATRLQAARTAREIALLWDRYRNLLAFAQRSSSKALEIPRDRKFPSMASVLPVVVKRLGDPVPAVRLAAAETVESAGASAWPYRADIAAATRDSDVFVRWVIARALGRILPEDPSAAEAVNVLSGMLADPDVDVRTAALNSIQGYGPRAVGAASAVIAAMNRGDVDVRIVAANTLESITKDAKDAPAQQAVAALAEVVRNSDIRLRRVAADALGRYGSVARAALPALREAQRDIDATLRRKANRAIVEIES